MDNRIEGLARAMCTALDIDPDDKFQHGYEWSPFPEHIDPSVAVPGGLLYSPNWHRFAWRAQQWIFTNSGGQLGTER